MIRQSRSSPGVQREFAVHHCNVVLARTFRNGCLSTQYLQLYKCGTRRRAPTALAITADLYQVLHVSPTASKAQISASYRRLARKYHPDVNASEEAVSVYEAIRVAYDVLSSDVRRKQYDEYGAGFWPGNSRNQRSDTYTAAKGGDVLTVVYLSFLEAALGKSHSLQVSAKRACPECVGSGSRPGSRPVFCKLCRGCGTVRAHHAGFDGSGLRLHAACPACGATGIVRQEWCTRCGGDGRASSTVALSVAIPAGVDAESVLKISGQGDAGRGGGALGDLYITFVVQASAGMRRQGLDMHSDVVVGYTDAILGAITEVPTIHGLARLHIPAGTQSGQVLTMRGAGISPGAAGLALRDGPRQLGAGSAQRGAHHFTVTVLLPRQVSEEERVRLRKLRRLQDAAEWSTGSSQAWRAKED